MKVITLFPLKNALNTYMKNASIKFTMPIISAHYTHKPFFNRSHGICLTILANERERFMQIYYCDHSEIRNRNN